MSYYEAIRRFLETLDALPMTYQLQAFAQAQEFPLPRRPAGGHVRALADVRRQFAAEGRWAPTAPPPRRLRPPYDFESVSVRRPGEQRRVRRHSKEACVTAIAEYLDELKPGENAAQKHYLAWSLRKGRPTPSAFARHGGWTALLAEARALRRS